MNNLTEIPQWQALQAHHQHIATLHMRDMFASEADRFSRFSQQGAGILLDYSKNRINQDTIKYLLDLAEARQLSTAIEQLFTGQRINTTEQRAAFHTALRASDDQLVQVDGQDIAQDVMACLA